MRKLIDIADEHIERLKIEAVKQGKSFKSYLEDKILMKGLDERINYIFTHENGFEPVTLLNENSISELTQIILSETQESRGVSSYLIDSFNLAYGYDDEMYDEKEENIDNLLEKKQHLIQFMKDIVGELNMLIEANQEMILELTA
jgi:hypothetical protein